MGCLWQRSRGAPTALLPRTSVLVFLCPRHDAVAAAAIPPDCSPQLASAPTLQLAPPCHGCSRGRGGLCLQTSSDHPATLLFNTRHSLDQEGGAIIWAATLGVGLAWPSEWSHFHCLNAGWPKFPGSLALCPGAPHVATVGVGRPQEGSE